MRHLLSVAVRHDRDVVTARQRAGHIAQLLGFDVSEQTRIATAVSEIVRNAFRYATGGSVSFEFEDAAAPQRLVVRVTDSGPGIPALEDVMAGRYRSASGMGLGIVGARRLVDRFTIESSASGTSVVLEKHLGPRHGVVTPDRARAIAAAIAGAPPDSLVDEIHQQNQALLRSLDEVQRKQEELAHLNRELEDTNRGVVALYAELDEKADYLRRADELKSRFLSNMTHEFRTPVNSIIGLANLLIDDRQRDGLEPQPEAVYIRKAAEQLSELVNDLLDLARMDAGKTVVRPVEFDAQQLFGALRGMLRPMLLNESVALVFDCPDTLPPLHTDDGKVGQILRNLISNALKFTERGEVRVSAAAPADGTITFAVADTGIGIAPADHSRIFEEFGQIEHPLQGKVKGTGLGLPLSRRLAELLGGSLTVESTPGVGSTFFLTIPVRFEAIRSQADAAFRWVPDPAKLPLLVLDEADDSQYFYEKVLRTSAYQVYPAFTVQDAAAALAEMTPAAIVLDIAPAAQEAWAFLVRLRRAEKTERTPVVIASAGGDRDKALALGADAYLVKPIERRQLLDTLTAIQARTAPAVRVLVVDDEEIARYLVRQCLPVPAFEIIEAASGEEGLRCVREDPPDVVILDLVLPDLPGQEVLRRLRADPSTREIPVIVVTSQVLGDRDAQALLEAAHAVFSKADLSRGTLGEAVRVAAARRARAPH
jgi:signal transduction histidine kinase/CheY-like chemotaxis protein